MCVPQVVLPLGDEPDKRSGKRPKLDKEAHPEKGRLAEGVTGETVAIRKAPDLEAIKRDLKASLTYR